MSRRECHVTAGSAVFHTPFLHLAQRAALKASRVALCLVILRRAACCCGGLHVLTTPHHPYQVREPPTSTVFSIHATLGHVYHIA